MTRLACAALVALVLSSSARAADVADEAEFHFRRGNTAYRAGKYEEALSEWYASNRLVANRNVQFNIARCLEQLSLFDEAFRAYSELEGQKLPAAEQKEVRDSIGRLRSHLALVKVTSEPPGASIFVGRRDLGSLGTTPKLLALQAGSAKVILDLEGYRSAEASVKLARGGEAKVALTLERIYGSLDFPSLPANAEVRRDKADGEVLRTGPGTLKLLPGSHVLFVTAPGFVAARVSQDVKPDQVTPVEVPLTPTPPPSGALVVRSNVDGALVRVDGKEMGFTPTVVEPVRAGRREIEVSKEGRTPFSIVIELKDGERRFIDARMRPAGREVEAATKELIRAEDAPASISIVTRDEILAFGWNTLAEALAGVRGAFASYDRGYESIGVRGFSPPGDYNNRLLILVDGHVWNEAIVGQGYVGRDLDVDLSQVERIEVVRGPGSLLYGSAAIFGVVNVVTRRPQFGAHGEAGGEVGSLGETLGRAAISARGEWAEGWATAGYLDSKGEQVYDPGPTGTPSQNADGEHALHAAGGGRVGDFSLHLVWNDRQKEQPTSAFDTLPQPGTHYHDQRLASELAWRRELTESIRLSLRAAFDHDRYDGRYVYADGTATDFDQSEWATGEARLELKFGGPHRLAVGAELGHRFKEEQGAYGTDGKLTFHDDRTESIVGAYALADYLPADWLRLHGGVRVDDYLDSFGLTVNPRAAAIAQPYKGGNTKLLFGRAFRAPSAYERFYNDAGITQKAAGPLDPEQVLTGELEHAHQIEEEVTVTGAVFASWLTGLIGLEKDQADGLLVYRNGSEPVRSIGAELEVRYEPGAGTLLTATYAYQATRYANSGGHLVNSPDHVASGRFAFPLLGPSLRIATEAVFVGGRLARDGSSTNDSLVWNVMLTGEWRRVNLRWHAGIHDLLDERVQFPVGEEIPSRTVPSYGRMVRLGASIGF